MSVHRKPLPGAVQTADDPEIATRAPESDLHEESLGDNKTPLAYQPDSTLPTHPPETSQAPFEADLEEESLEDDKTPLTSNTTSEMPTHPPGTSQPPLSEHCATDRPLPTDLSENPSGELTTWHISTNGTSTSSQEVEVYISKPSSYPSSPARLLLILTNGTGIHSLNNKHQADLLARSGYLAIMPDMFNKDPAPNSKPAEESLSSDASWLATVKVKVAETAKSFGLDMWLARHTEETVMPILQGVLKQAREEFADAVSHGDGVYCVGYCIGGKYALLLAGERAAGEPADAATALHEIAERVEQGEVKHKPEVKCAVCAHGAMVGRRDLHEVKVPVQLVCVEDDPLFPEVELEEGRKVLEKDGIEHDVRVYPNVPHGESPVAMPLLVAVS